ncbi:GNAT family N-acetyltransferase [Clostridium chauvoei]|uniref:GNAT family N-acetyltransferase n=2 Tax=Clostridium chauvoei TaxID=46867 RepID=A0ABD4RGR9_9CLOT|nr:GNAT family N-acetyltransferase [Clostridium chauvoei]ATD55614.1 GNAT family N-acetyltransferase [Clostridium chauvoei]ATD56709.1 GNAT family N-acetyltransferase [Clostridium chauvoei]MBX7280151.1 GNAT family N-acetyltransferase [Clostridium chauvoei]MBX7282635.1 GNAT family N-acetyltransferase [Clostridium chauvoei]MBX7285042.1 GNAT family N-acetyltransferase [Clostridium chauvoei]
MQKVLDLIRKDGKVKKATLKELNISYIDKIMELQNIILNGLEDKTLYAPTEKEEFIEYFKKGAKILGYITDENILVAMGVYIEKGYDDGNYGYDIELEGEELLKVGQIESTVVREEFRGNRLQRIICQLFENVARENNIKILCATAAPHNKFSVDTFEKLGYEVSRDKIKYGGYRRYVLVKNI